MSGPGSTAPVGTTTRSPAGRARYGDFPDGPPEPPDDGPLLDHVDAPREAPVAAVLDPAGAARDHWLLDGRRVPVTEGETAHLRCNATRPDVLSVVLARSVALRARLGLELPGAPS